METNSAIKQWRSASCISTDSWDSFPHIKLTNGLAKESKYVYTDFVTSSERALTRLLISNVTYASFMTCQKIIELNMRNGRTYKLRSQSELSIHVIKKYILDY